MDTALRSQWDILPEQRSGEPFDDFVQAAVLMRRIAILLLFVAVAGCAATATSPATPPPTPTPWPILADLPSRISGYAMTYGVANAQGLVLNDPAGWEANFVKLAHVEPRDVSIATGFAPPEIGYESTVIATPSASGHELLDEFILAFGGPGDVQELQLEGRNVRFQQADGEAGYYYLATDKFVIEWTVAKRALVLEALEQIAVD